MGKQQVDVVIPVFRPQKDFEQLLTALKNQTIRPEKVVLMITRSDQKAEITFPEELKIEIHELDPAQFDHAGTRNQGISYCTSEYVLLLTQDVLIEENDFIDRLLKPLKDRVIVSFARQKAKKDASFVEQETRLFNYPDIPEVHQKADLKRLGIKTYFMSDVACLYDREKFLELGGFSEPAIFNEDMVFAAKLIQEDYQISYTADAVVYHSHNYSLRMAFKRQFDLGVSQKMHPEVFENISSEKEGASMVKTVTLNLLKKAKIGSVIIFYMQCAAKYAGYLWGKNYLKLSKNCRKKLSLNSAFWEE